MIELYHNDMSTCAKKVRLVLAEKNLEWTSHHMDLRAGDTRTPEYISKFNPLGVVPTLVDDGTIIYESSVIMEYLEDAYPDTPLRPGDARQRARMRLWTKQLDEGVHAATGVISTCIAFRHQMFAGRSDQQVRDFIDAIPDVARRERSHEMVFTGLGSIHFAPAILRFEKLFTDMEAALVTGPWLAGDTYSLADIAYTPYLTRYDHLQLLGVLDKRPRLANWYDRVKARHSYGEALGKWFNPKYLTLMKEHGSAAWPKVREITG
jgi:glutathione S-transferase